MVSNEDMQRLQGLVRLAPYMTLEQRQGLLDLIRKLKAAEGTSAMPASAVQAMVDAIDDKTMRAIVEEQRHRPEPSGWLKPGPSEPVVRGTGWAPTPKPEDRSRQFQMFDDMVNYWAGGQNDTSKLK